MDNAKKIEAVYKLNEELDNLLENESEFYKKAMLYKDEEVKRGHEKVTIGELFEETRVTGLEGESSTLLKNRFKDLFDVAEKREKKTIEMRDTILKEFGFDFSQMTLGNYMKITEALIDYKLKK
jgi:hypothetical protein